MKKLTSQSSIYLHILYIIWELIFYYSRLFGIDAGEEPAKIPVVHVERDGLTILRFRFLSYATPNAQNYTPEEIREVLQGYLQYGLLPEQTALRPYVGGSTIYDIVEPLYIDKVERTDRVWWVQVVYVDNPLAFRYVQECKGLKGGYLL